jgi:hypothetical protein
MRPEYDFSGAIRGKYYRRYEESSNVVVIEPDVHKRFRNSAAVNEALRSLLRPTKKRRAQSKRVASTRARGARTGSR